MRYGKLNAHVFFEADKGGSSGGKSDAGGDKGKKDGETPPDDSLDFGAWLRDQPESVRKAYAEHTKGLKSALDAERDRAKQAEKAKAEQDRAKEKAAEEELAKNQEFQKLADERQKKLDELSPKLDAVTQELDAARKLIQQYESLVKADLDETVKSLELGEATMELLSGKTVLEQREWIAKNRDELVKVRAKGAPPTPKTGGGGPDDAGKKQLESWYAQQY